MKKITLLLVLIFGVSYGQTPMHRFNFENNLQNTANNLTLTGSGTSYVAGRDVASGQALLISNTTGNPVSYIDSSITGLSLIGGSFSYSFWVKQYTSNAANKTIKRPIIRHK